MKDVSHAHKTFSTFAEAEEWRKELRRRFKKTGRRLQIFNTPGGRWAVP